MPEVSPTPDWGAQTVASDAESSVTPSQPGNKARDDVDIRVLQDVNRFGEMKANWKYEGKYRFLDRDQADREVAYLSRKI